jgi:hypothetical protein
MGADMLDIFGTFRRHRTKRRASSLRSARTKRPTVRLEVLQLEDRLAPAVNLASSFAAMDWSVNSPSGFLFVPPDTNAASGPASVIETVNTAITIYNKSGGGTSTLLTSFFPSLTSATDTSVSYDELIGKFFIGVITTDTHNSFHYAISKNSTPASAADFDFYTVNVSAMDPKAPNTYFADFPRLGWNANEFAVTFNMFNGNAYDHVLVLNISAADPNPNTTPPTLTDIGSSKTDFTMVPARMHGSLPGSTAATPMYFVEETLNASSGNATGNSIRVWTETGPLGTPTFTSYDVALGAASYTPISPSTGFGATQKGSTSKQIEVNDSGFLNVECRDHHLVATQTILGSDGLSHARWYDLDTTNTDSVSPTAPTLFQDGTIVGSGPSSGASSYYPSIAIGATDVLAMTYMESSPTEYMSMYVTGRLLSDPLGTMETPVLAKAGLAVYTGLGRRANDVSPYRAGDFSGISVDPSDGTFWAANEYALTTTSGGWGTAIAHFDMGNKLIEDFDSSRSYTLAFPPANFQPSKVASHEHGRDYGLIDNPSNAWIYRTDGNANVVIGSNISVWLQFNNSADGQAAFAFDANTLPSGYADRTYALVVDATNHNLVVETENFTPPSGSSSSLGTSTIPALLPNHWYRLEVDWGTTLITGKLFDSNATTQIGTSVTATGNPLGFTAGGIGFHYNHGAGETGIAYWDTVTDPPASPGATIVQVAAGP